MIKRNIENKLHDWMENNRNALLISGARQIGKTTTIRQFCKENTKSYLELNMIENPEFVTMIQNAKGAADLLERFRIVSENTLVKGESIIFLDEVQKVPEIITMIKFLVDEGSYRYLLSGSLLGVELHNLRSAPVGYLSILEMYPIDFYEFLLASGFSENTIASIKTCFNNSNEVDEFYHNKLMDLFYRYLIVGGMPQAVQAYLDSGDIYAVRQIQKDIVNLYYLDFMQYASSNGQLKIKSIYDRIPSELNKQNKRFVFANADKPVRFDRYENSFLWLVNSGVAIATYNVEDLTSPLQQNRSSNLFKLYMSDVGLLNSFYSNQKLMRILNKDKDINNGALFENVAAQQLLCNGHKTYFYRKKNIGEVDFVIDKDGYPTPIEIKSGKDYKIHSALKNLISRPNSQIKEAYVFADTNVKKEGIINYLPIYMLMFLKETELEPIDLRIKI